MPTPGRTRRNVWITGLAALAPLATTRSSASSSSIVTTGLWRDFNTTPIRGGIETIRTTGFGQPGLGAGTYALDEDQLTGEETPSRRRSADGGQAAPPRWFRLAESRPSAEQLGAIGDGKADDTNALRALARLGGQVQLNRTYRVTGPIAGIPSGATVLFGRDAKILWDGPQPASSRDCRGILETERASDIRLIFASGFQASAGGGGHGRSEPTPKRNRGYIYLVRATAVQGLHLVGRPACHDLKLLLALPVAQTYEAVDIDSDEVCRNVVVDDGWSVRFEPKLSGNYEQTAAIDLRYVDTARIGSGQAVGSAHGVLAIGGDAKPSSAGGNGDPGNSRKCRNITIGHIAARHISGGGVWGSMVENFLIEGGDLRDIGDVGYDFEGCINAVARGGFAANCANGALSCFYFGRGVRFVDMAVEQPDGLPVFRLFNDSLNPRGNGPISIEGGRFFCRNGIAVLDSAGGPAFDLRLSRCVLENVRIDLSATNSHLTMIEDCTLTFNLTAATAFSALRVGNNNAVGPDAPGSVRLQTCRIQSTEPQRAGSIGIEIVQGDFNGSPLTSVRNCEIEGFPVDLKAVWQGSNPGVRGRFEIEQNRFAGGAASVVSSGAAPAFTLQKANTGRNGTAVPVLEARATPRPN